MAGNMHIAVEDVTLGVAVVVRVTYNKNLMYGGSFWVRCTYILYGVANGSGFVGWCYPDGFIAI